MNKDCLFFTALTKVHFIRLEYLGNENMNHCFWFVFSFSFSFVIWTLALWTLPWAKSQTPVILLGSSGTNDLLMGYRHVCHSTVGVYSSHWAGWVWPKGKFADRLPSWSATLLFSPPLFFHFLSQRLYWEWSWLEITMSKYVCWQGSLSCLFFPQK